MKFNKELIIGVFLFLVSIGSFVFLIIPPETKIYLSVFIALAAYKVFDLYHEDNKQDKEFEDKRQEMKKDSEEITERLDILRTIMEDNGYNQITTFKNVAEVEREAEEIVVITEDLLTDIEPNGEYTKDNEVVGLFVKEVHANIRRGIKYTYYLKNDMKTNRSIKNHIRSHYNKILSETPELKIQEPEFILIPSEKYCFFSEIYLYKKSSFQNDDMAFEWLPAVSDQRTLTMYYVNLDNNQVSMLNDILVNLHKDYYNVSKNEVMKIKESLK